MQELTLLEKQIVAALQTDPRASWRKIAAVLREPERTVARRGSELLESGLVAVRGIRLRPTPVLVEIRCAPGTSRVAVQALAQRRDTSFVYTVTGSSDCVAEILTDRHRLHVALADELPGIAGLQRINTYPILRYFKTLRAWQPGLLTPEQHRALQPVPLADPAVFGSYPEMTAVDEQIADALCEDGRMPFEALARRSGVSEATARRRTEWLLETNVVHLRALVEPALMGLPVEALLWIKTSPARLESLGQRLSKRPEVRYVAALTGEYQIVADVTVATNEALYEFTTSSDWTEDVVQLSTSLLLDARKRGGRVRPS
ncbi:AsnC family transcriptional regulator [Arthrobacter crystallopoietes BAB-32]|uniref:AsnC family transcriptional regulator n=1 Tax=Arthrobacter crystallopoietes BAB-32 TaxID=1246476 RepID=N1V1Z0_9MICC|nr:AsnC family transcriptional regulator [Arthrobacter crystallopoietes]EMY34019.1 AsnC family transcriptional regulator [Arthrobacter crystallopoietes BAB-32]